MNASISPELLEKIIKINMAHNEVMNELLSSINNTEQWTGTIEASQETGVNPDRIRYLVRTNQIRSRKLGPRKIEVLLSDLLKFASKRS